MYEQQYLIYHLKGRGRRTMTAMMMMIDDTKSPRHGGSLTFSLAFPKNTSAYVHLNVHPYFPHHFQVRKFHQNHGIIEMANKIPDSYPCWHLDGRIETCSGNVLGMNGHHSPKNIRQLSQYVFLSHLWPPQPFPAPSLKWSYNSSWFGRSNFSGRVMGGKQPSLAFTVLPHIDWRRFYGANQGETARINRFEFFPQLQYAFLICSDIPAEWRQDQTNASEFVSRYVKIRIFSIRYNIDEGRGTVVVAGRADG